MPDRGGRTRCLLGHDARHEIERRPIEELVHDLDVTALEHGSRLDIGDAEPAREPRRHETICGRDDETAPAGTIYLPDCSYREMTEWALPVDKLNAYNSLARDMRHDTCGSPWRL